MPTIRPVRIVAALSLVFAGTAFAAAEEDLRSRLEKKVYKNAEGETLPYRLYVPKNLDANKKYPIVLFLHGAGERGDDNEAQIKHAQVLRLISDDAAAKQPCILVAPQCPKNDTWAGLRLDRSKPYRTSAEPTKPMKLVMELLDSLEKEYPVDPSRRCVTGLSMGGFGSFDLCARRPKDFAAAMPICGGGDTEKAEAMKGIAFWVFHGGADNVVNPDFSRKMVQALKDAGAKVKYTEYEGVGHDSWSKAYLEPELVDWVFAQKRTDR